MNISYQKLDNGIAKTLLNISARLESILVAIGKLGAWLSLPLIAIIMFDIISRKFFVLGSTKLQEMEWHLHAALFLLALGYAYLKNSHVRIEVIRESFSTKLKAILEVIGVLIFILPYTGLIVWFGIDFVSRSYGMNEVSAALTGLSHRWIMKSFVPMGMAFLWLAGISVLLRNLSYLIGHKNNNKELMDTSQSMSPELANATEELIKEVKAEEKK
ncbi:MAG: TRAP transporter small permease subunit [Alphaproteobacteria bacterium]|jgi:TRAP-type mannitol/chloroaromatic compound transport system permease small subunit|tara:strand:+ start:228 stop:875 length:648 start_codon:yes stop_codon:yes gene_type:complete